MDHNAASISKHTASPAEESARRSGRYRGHLFVATMLLLLAAILRWDYLRTDESWLVSTKPRGPEVTLFFADDTASYLIPEVRQLAAGVDSSIESLAVAVLEALIAGPSTESGLFRTLPPETVIRDVSIEGDLLIADFGSELQRYHWGGSTGEILTVYSIVHTLLELPNIQRVWILIEGQSIETLSGHLDVSRPLAYNESLIPPEGWLPGE